MDDHNIEKELVKSLNLDRGFYTRLEQLIMSLMHTNERFLKVSKEFFNKFDITETQFNALMAIFDHYNSHGLPLNQKELAEKLLINKASAGTLIDRLLKNKWIRVEPSEEDRRAKNVFLTDLGLSKYKKVFEPYYLFMGPLTSNVSEEEVNKTLETLHKLRLNLSYLESGLSNDL